jgi:hypothetical protein
MAKLFGHFPGKDDSFDIETILSSLRRLIVRTIEVRQKFQLKKPSEYECILEPPIPYSEFVRLVKHLKTECNPRQTVSIITFNYDVGVDFALIVGGCRPWYGFGSETRRGEHVPLLKLHGSIGWGISTTDKTIVPLNIGRIIQNTQCQKRIRFFDTCTLSGRWARFCCGDFGYSIRMCHWTEDFERCSVPLRKSASYLTQAARVTSKQQSRI